MIKPLIALLVLIVVSVFTLWNETFQMPPQRILTDKYRIVQSQYSIDFISNRTGEELFSISPLEDYIYSDNKKDHIYNKTNYTAKNDLLTRLLRFFPRPQISWELTSKKIGVSYYIKENNAVIGILRVLSSNKIPDAIGQSVVFCFDCFVKDDKMRIYFNPNQTDDDKFKISSKLNLTPYIIQENQFLPHGIGKISVVDREGKTQFEVYTDDRQDVYYSARFHLLEFKTYIDKKMPYISQKVVF